MYSWEDLAARALARQFPTCRGARYAGDGQGDRYLGHNIACIAVDENGSILDFDFNHNELFNSSAEHAEARLVRRLFSLNQATTIGRQSTRPRPRS